MKSSFVKPFLTSFIRAMFCSFLWSYILDLLPSLHIQNYVYGLFFVQDNRKVFDLCILSLELSQFLAGNC